MGGKRGLLGERRKIGVHLAPALGHESLVFAGGGRRGFAVDRGGQHGSLALLQFEPLHVGEQRAALPGGEEIGGEIGVAEQRLVVHGDADAAGRDGFDGAHLGGIGPQHDHLEGARRELAGERRLRHIALRPHERDLAPLHAERGCGGVGHAGRLFREIEGDRLQGLHGGQRHPTLAVDLRGERRDLDGPAVVPALRVHRQSQRSDLGRQVGLGECDQPALQLRGEGGDGLGGAAGGGKRDLGIEGAAHGITVRGGEGELRQLGDHARGRIVDARAHREGQAIDEGLVAFLQRYGAERERLGRGEFHAAAIELGVDDENAGKVARDRARLHHRLRPPERNGDERDAREFRTGAFGREALVLEIE